MFAKMLTKSVEKDVYVIVDGDDVKAGSKKGEFVLVSGDEKVAFTANKVPKVGDAIVKQSKKDVYHVPAGVLAEKYYVDGAPEAVEGVVTADEVKEFQVKIEKLEAQLADKTEECETLEKANEVLTEKYDELTTPLDQLPPKDYNPAISEGMDIREAEAAAREGKAFTCNEWCTLRVSPYITYDKSTESYMWNRDDAKAKPVKLGDADRKRKNYYLVPVK